MENPKLTLEVCVVTFGQDGGRRLEKMNLPKLPGVSYIVSWQERGDVSIPPSIAGREDVRVLDLKGLGSSRNRNNCLDNASGDILYFADDDLQLYPGGLKKIVETFQNNPELEYGSFCYDSDVPKKYPAKSCSLARLPRNFYQTTFEIAIRRTSSAGKLRFSEQHGFAVVDFTAGEDELFLKRARVKGLNCWFFPIKVAFHQGSTSGVRERLDRGTMLMQGAFTLIEYPLTAVFRILLGAYRIEIKKQATMGNALRSLFLGAWKELVGRKAYNYIHSSL